MGEERYQAVWSDLGRVEYARSFQLQAALRERTTRAGNPGYILFLEHPPTITLGYSLRGDYGRASIRSTPGELKAAGIEVFEADRGGKATYHGPGQLVCYLILSLKELGLGVKRYVGKLEEAVAGAVSEWGLPAGLDPLYPGVWVRGAKIAAVGVRVMDRVASHGFALNVDPELAAFAHIIPCGIPDRPVTSLAALGVKGLPRGEVIERLLPPLAREFKLGLKPAGAEEIWAHMERGTAQ